MSSRHLPGYWGAWMRCLGCLVPILLMSFIAMFLLLERGSRGGNPMIGCRLPGSSVADGPLSCSLLVLQVQRLPGMWSDPQ